ncbi:MAG TPA: hypothetical protein VLK30_14210 [Candidatus Limnocylindrales bacterium]|nr:hypothetical protein [Candidatus Limnocylindrales bacterium]
MNSYVNEDVMWQRLKDIQREAENRRLAGSTVSGALRLVAMLAERAWLLAGLAMRRPPRRSPARLLKDRPDVMDHVA